MKMPKFVSDAGGAWKTALTSNQPINKVEGMGNFMTGIPDAISIHKRGESEGLMDSLKQAHSNDDGGMSVGKIAGSIATVSAGYRVASGGGLYRDKDGNADLIGVPFV